VSEQPTPQQEFAEIRRRYVLRNRHADRSTAVVELQWVRQRSDPWRTVLNVTVPWTQLDLPTALTVCQWLAGVLQQELEGLPGTLEGRDHP
jgi:hypothetical protein